MRNTSIFCRKVPSVKKTVLYLFLCRQFRNVVWLLFLLLGTNELKAQLPTDFQKVELLTGLSNATTMQFAPDGRIFILDRFGEVKIYHTDTQLSVSSGVLPVFHEFEDGLLGIAFDPNFLDNDYIYLHYSVFSSSTNRVSRFTMNGDILDVDSEVTLLEWPVQRVFSFHAGGDMAFDSQGNLYIATGDNTDHGNYGALSETNPTKSAEKSSSNTNDYRGKILRITPQTNGTYTVPSGNLFPNGVGGKPEIYVMGARNPYRIFVDKTNTDWLFWGEVGPDANSSSSLGPEGMDEMNLVKSAGNYGWPYFSGKNEAYQISYASTPYYNNQNAPQNISTWNTGSVALPPAQPSWLEFFHKSYFAGPRYYYDGTLSDPQRLPVELDEVFFYYDFNTSKIWAVQMDANGTILSNDQLAPSVFPKSSNGFIDMEIGPDGHMYILAYGTGCCPDNSGTGKLLRIDYTGEVSNSPPKVVLNANVTSGSLPLSVEFSSAGTVDPNGDSPLAYAWDFQSDGTVDSTQENPTFTFTSPGTFNVQLKVDDGNGGIGVKNSTIHAGNNAATFTFNSPPDGGFMAWDDDIDFDLTVSDIEDGSTSSGIACSDVSLVPSLGHLNHFHDGVTINGCPKILTLDPGSHDTNGEMDIFYVLNANYTDEGGLTSFDQLKLYPKRMEAEFFSEASDVLKISNTDASGGGSEAIRADHGGYIVFEDRNLLNIDAIRYRISAAAIGGTIEFRTGGVTGPLLATTNIPVTGSTNNWVDVESTFTDPGGKNNIYFVFKNNPGQQNIFDINYIEFIGSGVSIDNSPPEVVAVSQVNATELGVEFSEYITKDSAENLANYSIDNGITVTAAVLQADNRTVMLTHSQLGAGTTYSLSIGNVENNVGLAVITNSYPISIFDPVRINVGGPSLTFDGNTFLGDQNANGGKLFSNDIAIANTSNDELYQTERFQTFSYDIPLPIPGTYDIRLHFAELYFGVGSVSGGPGSRVFNVTIEGNPVLTDFDILEETTPATAIIKDFDNVSITDGVANIQFLSVIENPKVSAIEILPADAFTIAPTIVINSPTNGASVNQPFDIAFTVQNWEISEGSTHMHYYIDDVMVGPHYSYGPLTINDLSLGNHTIKLELYEAGHVPTGIFDEVTVNVSDQNVCGNTPFPDQWQVHELESNELPYRSVYILPQEDLDGDGLKDIVTGAWWYKNPGSASGNWERKTIGNSFNNMAHIHDFDNDGDMDMLGTTGAYTGSDLVWAQNDGTGNFTIHNNIPAGNTNYSEPFLAGISGGIFQNGGPYQMAINWNGAESTGSPVQMLSVPVDPVNTTWPLVDISPDSLGEDIQKGDIDGDGDLDLFQSSNWLRNEGNGNWTTIATGISYVTTPDRAQLADFDGDGDLDAVVGQLSLGTSSSEKTEFAWFEAPADPTQPWTKRILATDINGSLSVVVSDIDFDGDEDIVVGEWKGNNRLLTFENDLCNSGTWITHTINAGGTGFDHHDGAQVVDIDNDGDLDIVSIGWDNIVPRIFENKSTVSNSVPIVNAGDDREINLPTSELTLNGSGNDPDGGPITFLWTQQNGPNTATLTNFDTADLTASNLVAGNYTFRLTVTDDENDNSFDEVTVTVVPESTEGGFTLRINTGGSQSTFNGEEFIDDQYFNTGSTLDRPQTGLSQPYRSIRYSRSQTMNYDLPVPNGAYTVRLHFAETWFGATGGGEGAVGNRVFDVRMENELVEDNLDVFAEVGAEKPLVKTHTAYVNDGMLNIDFSSLAADGGSRHPIINAIEVIGSGSPSAPPVAEAGNNQTITLPSTTSVTFNGSGHDPDGGPVTFLWTQVSGPNLATLSDENTANLTATGLLAGNYVFRLTVTDQDNETTYDEVTLTAQSSGGGQSPIVSAGENQNINLPTANITLNGSGSDPDGGTVTFQWTQVSGPNSASLSDENTANLSVAGLLAGNYVFRLTVTDENNDTVSDEVALTVESSSPIVDAGGNRNINLPTSNITLNGSGSDPDGGTVTYQWTQQNGPNSATLTNSNSVNLIVANLVVGDYTFRLTVIDDENDTVFDEVNVTVQPEPTESDFFLRINAGGLETTYNGNEFIADQHFDTGSILNRPQTGLPEPYRSFRFSRSQLMGYDIPLPDGAYTVRLHFAELWFGATGGGSGGTGSRVFDVRLENELVEDNLDVFASVGADALLVRTHSVSITDGVLNIDFSALESDGGSRHPIINAIEIVGEEGGQPSLEPIANAGQDQSIVLPTDEVVLNGSGSDPDGGAVSYQWAQVSGPNAATLSSVMNSELNASNLIEGSYVFRLTITDDENQANSDEVGVTVGPEVVSLSNHIWLEAECADVGANWLIRTDDSVSGGKYLEAPSGNHFYNAPTDEDSSIRFDLSVEEGTYNLFALVDTPTGDNDSFWVRANNGPWLKWNYILGGNGFNWRQLHDKERRSVFVTLDLNEGNNTIVFAHREQGAKLDKIYVTKNGELPTGFGGTDFNCSLSGKNSTTQTEVVDLYRNMEAGIASDLLVEQSLSVVSLYPNPAHTEVYISLQKEQKEAEYIAIYTMDGTLVKMEKADAIQVEQKLYKLDVSILKPEMYVVRVVTSDGESTIHKILISN
ncbi:PKD domain-containing protein [Zobellia alginiliquefaciens]|uniref:PKD domain-containing protein n=1 Tax=Zobellia alginiliquefaciens TaxID=3032586 RepID=UPI0023E4077E|nr:malectin domain-containing carbohydrate-binding protein [Zobellia alginiliquefaciens]